MNLKKLCVSICLAATPMMAQAQTANIDELIAAAKQEGTVNSVGMPDTWANWKDTWADLKTLYGLSHQDTDMSSAQEIAKFAAEKDNATADIGDVGGGYQGTADKACKDGQDKTQCFDQVATFKRVYKVKLDPSKDTIEKIAYIDLMNIQDPENKAKRDLVDGKFVFPFFTIENVDFVGDKHIIVGNDNNYPKSSSREPNKADDNELILLDVSELRQAK